MSEDPGGENSAPEFAVIPRIGPRRNQPRRTPRAQRRKPEISFCISVASVVQNSISRIKLVFWGSGCLSLKSEARNLPRISGTHPHLHASIAAAAVGQALVALDEICAFVIEPVRDHFTQNATAAGAAVTFAVHDAHDPVAKRLRVAQEALGLRHRIGDAVTVQVERRDDSEQLTEPEMEGLEGHEGQRDRGAQG